jgi:apolipoprotein N-acyltransferase
MAEPDPPEAVIWSETSFVPGIDWHTRFRTDPFRYDLVRELTDFLATQDVPYVIGNADRRLERDESGRDLEISYNAVLLYEDGEIRETYRKRHLVPFTEHFPYERQFPWMHQALLEADTHFWGYGRDLTVFETDGIRFSTPICFEDTFGYLSRDFVRNGAEVIVNLTNDSWAMSVPAAMQHMAMAVFRATENRRSVVRSTNGGMTSIIDPNGVITDIYPAFQEGYLIGDAPIYTGETTLYTRYGDWYAVVMLVIAAAGLLTGLGLFLRRRSRRA